MEFQLIILRLIKSLIKTGILEDFIKENNELLKDK